MSASLRAAAGLAALAAGLLAGAEASAQPDPSFRASCAELRRSIAALRYTDDQLVGIQVVGELTLVRSDGALAYLMMCRPPDPQVLCVTYSTNGRKAGDRVVLTGTFSPRGPDHILLDPCLHSEPE